MGIKEIDSNMADRESKKQCLDWYDPKVESRFRLTGFPYIQTDGVYRRLPLAMKETLAEVNQNLNVLSENTAGGQIAFCSDTTSISIRATIGSPHNLSTMSLIGESGFDVYISINGERLRYVGASRFEVNEMTYECEMVADLPQGVKKEVVINFPLYNSVLDVTIGLDEGACVLPPKEYTRKGKLVFYGTSITQGGCASRPGMAYTNILSRWLDTECINFGFSGNGYGEIEIARTIAELQELSLLVIDYEANSGMNGKLEATLETFVTEIRKRHTSLPILIVSRIPYVFDEYDDEMREKRTNIRNFQREFVQSRNEMGDERIYFLDGSKMFGEGYDEYTVDTVHPTDLGFHYIAKSLYQAIMKILTTVDSSL